MRNQIHKLFLWLFPILAIMHYSNWREDRWKYPQTWWLMPRRWIKMKNQFYKNGHNKLKRAKLRIFIEKLCGFLTEHELSKTEFGFGYGNFIDRNCRWCDKHFQIPKSEEPTKTKFFKELWNK